MSFIVEKISIDYPEENLLLIWEKSLSMFATKEAVKHRIEWTYNQNICGKGQMWLLKKAESNVIVGCSALIPRFFLLNGQKVTAALMADTAIIPKHRSLGPALKLHKEILKSADEFSLIIAFPDDTVEGILKVVGFKKAVTLVHIVKILKSSILLDVKIKHKLFSKILLPFCKIFDFGLWLVDYNTGKNSLYTGDFIDDFSKTFDEMWELFRYEFDFLVEKKFDYLSWRYTNSPFRDYKIFVVEKQKSKKIVGFFVFYAKESSIFVEDYLWLNNEIEFRYFVSIFINAVRKQLFKSISFYVEDNSIIHQILRKRLFLRSEIKSDQKIMYFTKNKKMQSDLSKSLKNLFLNIGDRDI